MHTTTTPATVTLEQRAARLETLRRAYDGAASAYSRGLDNHLPTSALEPLSIAAAAALEEWILEWNAIHTGA